MGRICSVCGEYLPEKITTLKLTNEKFNNILPPSYDIISCEKCGFCYADTIATEKEYEQYYKESNNYVTSPKNRIETIKNYRKIIEYISQYVNLNNEILDVGFGDGIFLNMLLEAGYTNIKGIDPSSNSVKLVSEKNIACKVGDIYHDLDFEDSFFKYNMIFAFGVFEHLLFPQIALLNIKKYLAIDGYVVIGVPSYAVLDFDLPVVNYFNQEHINYFSFASIKNLLDRCGFEEVAKYSMNTSVNKENTINSLFVIYKNSSNKETGRDFYEKDEITKKVITEYFQLNRKQVEKLNLYFNKILVKYNKILIWGAGAYSLWIYSNTVLAEREIILFIDNNTLKQGKMVGAIPIVAPSCLLKNEKYKDVPILICSMLHSEDILHQIEEMGISNAIIKLNTITND